jgi:hypothetical protein
MAVFWVVVLCSLVEIYHHFRGEVIITLKMEAASTSETLVNFYLTAWCNNPEDSRLHTDCCENLKSHTLTLAHVVVPSELKVLVDKSLSHWTIVNNECNNKVVIAHRLASSVLFILEAWDFFLHCHFQNNSKFHSLSSSGIHSLEGNMK